LLARVKLGCGLLMEMWGIWLQVVEICGRGKEERERERRERGEREIERAKI